MEFKISPSFGQEKLKSGKIEDKLDVHEDRIRGWLINPARELLKVKEGAFASFALSLSYFEGHQFFRTGQDSNGQSKTFFREGFLAVFFTSTPGNGMEGVAMPADFLTILANKLYELARCGIFHTGLAREGIFIGTTDAPISTSVEKASGKISAILIDAGKFLGDVEAEFNVYMKQVRDPAQKVLRANFEKAWAIMHPGSAIHVPPTPP